MRSGPPRRPLRPGPSRARPGPGGPSRARPGPGGALTPLGAVRATSAVRRCGRAVGAGAGRRTGTGGGHRRCRPPGVPRPAHPAFRGPSQRRPGAPRVPVAPGAARAPAARSPPVVPVARRWTRPAPDPFPAGVGPGRGRGRVGASGPGGRAPCVRPPPCGCRTRVAGAMVGAPLLAFWLHSLQPGRSGGKKPFRILCGRVWRKEVPVPRQGDARGVRTSSLVPALL